MSTHVPPVGPNQTGILDHPELTLEMLEATRLFPPSSEGSDDNLAELRLEYGKRAQQGDPAGSMPKTTVANPSDELIVLLDHLGARLAFERTGVRLYDGLIAKHEAYGSWEGGPSRSELEQLRDEEYEHFSMLRRAVRESGGDPTAITPAANLELLIGSGVVAAIADPRLDLLQSLEAIMVAELADHEGWHVLIDLAQEYGFSEWLPEFKRALNQEEDHLEYVRRWIAAAQNRIEDSSH
ncbi:MAG: ferritin-like domain-containing protein [Deltaproteobacteria bacterium]|nr:ferritin-like domain-containing protein [Deltaproteobacteria bacterium]